jgi:hypothetical protein
MPSVILAGTTTGTALSLTSDTSGELQIQTNNGSTTAMTLTTGGNVGVGTTSPTSRLVVQQANNTGDAFRVFASGTDTQLIARYLSSSDLFQISASFAITGAYKPIAFFTSDAERMRITSAGLVTIGTSTPAGILTIATQSGTSNNMVLNGSATAGAWTQYVNTGGNFYVGLDNSTGGNFGAAYSANLYQGGAYPILFHTNATERMRIGSDGNITFKGSYVSFNDNGYIRNDIANSFAIQAGSSSSVGFQLRDAGNSNTLLSMNGTNGFSLALQGASSVAGTGITFPATQVASANANTLDDYEEGEWTPILGRLTTDPTITYADRRGTYVKIGRMVYCMAFFNVSSISAAGSGLNQIAGLPFAAEGAGSSRWVLNVGLNESLTSATSGYIIANATFGFFYNTTNQTNPNANYTTGQIYVSFSYQTN